MARSVTLALAGDVMLGRGVDPVIAERGPFHPWGDLRPVLERADAVLINLECVLTEHRREWTYGGVRKAFYFRAEPERGIACLNAGRVTVAAIANNHTGDYGNSGLVETIATLERAGIAHAGAGRDLAAARRPARCEVAGVRVAVVAFADHPAEWAATPSSPGINYVPISTLRETRTVVMQAVAEARHGADVVVCSLHWGPNMRPRPTPTFRAFARFVIEAGADVVFGHSAHIVQGIEIYRGKPILYDTGDFIDDYMTDRKLRNDLSALFLLRLVPPGVETLDLLPVHVDYGQTNRATGEDRAWFARRVAALSAELGTEIRDDGEYLHVLMPGASMR